MKKLSALLSLTLSLGLIPAVFAANKPTTPAAKPAPTATKPAAQPAAKAAAKPEAKPAANAEKKAEEPVVGAMIERADGSFLNLKVEGGNFVILFLNKAKEPAPADMARAIIRYRRHLRNNQFVLNRADDGKSLRASKPVDHPYVFPALPVILFKETSDENAAEIYSVQFKQPMPGDGEGIPIDEMTPEQLQKIEK